MHNVNEPLQKRMPTRKDEILQELASIDTKTSKPRIMRELQLNKAASKVWLQSQDDAAAALRAELATLL